MFTCFKQLFTAACTKRMPHAIFTQCRASSRARIMLELVKHSL